MVTFGTIATNFVAISIFVFWCGKWTIHILAISYGKIKLHKKTRLKQRVLTTPTKSSIGGGGGGVGVGVGVGELSLYGNSYFPTSSNIINGLDSSPSPIACNQDETIISLNCDPSESANIRDISADVGASPLAGIHSSASETKDYALALLSDGEANDTNSLDGAHLPKVSILKPLMGSDPNLLSNLETFFTMNYPRQAYELLFCVESYEDPALNVCRELMNKYKNEDVDARLFVGGFNVGVNPKINNMQLGYQEAKYEMIMISDAGIKMKPDTLLDMVENMTEHVGLVHQMPFTSDREGFAATYEKIFFGTVQSRIYLAANLLGVICHTGMSCLIRKKILEDLGGLRAFGCYLAEDFFMAKSIMEAGWKITISSYPALQNSGICDLPTFQNRLTRWAKLRIAMMSWLIFLEPMSECFVVGAFTAWSVSILFNWDSIVFYLIHILCWFLSDWLLLSIVQNGTLPFNKFDFVVGWLFRECTGPYLFMTALWNPAIRWRTRIYKLAWGGIAHEITDLPVKIKT